MRRITRKHSIQNQSNTKSSRVIWKCLKTMRTLTIQSSTHTKWIGSCTEMIMIKSKICLKIIGIWILYQRNEITLKYSKSTIKIGRCFSKNMQRTWPRLKSSCHTHTMTTKKLKSIILKGLYHQRNLLIHNWIQRVYLNILQLNHFTNQCFWRLHKWSCKEIRPSFQERLTS